MQLLLIQEHSIKQSCYATVTKYAVTTDSGTQYQTVLLCNCDKVCSYYWFRNTASNSLAMQLWQSKH